MTANDDDETMQYMRDELTSIFFIAAAATTKESLAKYNTNTCGTIRMRAIAIPIARWHADIHTYVLA